MAWQEKPAITRDLNFDDDDNSGRTFREDFREELYIPLERESSISRSKRLSSSLARCPSANIPLHQRNQEDQQRCRPGKIPINVNDIMQLLCHLSTNEKIKVAYRYSKRGALVAGATAFIGGLLGGPSGIFVGGAVGGLLGSCITSGKFKSIPQIILELPPDEQKRLYEAAIAIVRELDWNDRAELTALVMQHPDVRQKLLDVLKTFLKI